MTHQMEILDLLFNMQTSQLCSDASKGSKIMKIMKVFANVGIFGAIFSIS